MARNKFISNFILFPISLLYGLGVYVRNKLFDWHLLKQYSFSVPVIVVGNISAGGTGKTPHVEYIVEMLSRSHNIAVISRGYKRATKGFMMATQQSTPKDIGDEPYQIYHKFNKQISVAVCEDRVTGINEVLRIDPKINLIVLDDAFQHRYVQPTVSVVITEFNRPVYQDRLLPLGRLRESKHALRRADIVIVSKCPDNTKAMEMALYDKNLDLFPYQSLYFSKFDYGCLKPVFPESAPSVAPSLDWLTGEDHILAVAGIGNPRPFIKYIKQFKAPVWVNLFSDHHNFSKKDMTFLKSRYEAMSGRNNFIITTEKDAVRMANNKYFPEEMKKYTYYLPIKVKILRDEATAFEDTLLKLINPPS